MRKLQDNVVKMEVVWNKDNVRVIHGIMKMPGPVSNREIVAVILSKQMEIKLLLETAAVISLFNMTKMLNLLKFMLEVLSLRRWMLGRQK